MKKSTGHPEAGALPVGTHTLHCKQSSVHRDFVDSWPTTSGCGHTPVQDLQIRGWISVP